MIKLLECDSMLQNSEEQFHIFKIFYDIIFKGKPLLTFTLVI